MMTKLAVSDSAITPDYISKAVGEVKRLKPDYGLLLGLYERIFIEQEISKASVHLPEFRIPADSLAVKLQEKFPLVEIPQFLFDGESADGLFMRICTILVKSDNELSQSVKKIIENIDNKTLSTGHLFSAYMRQDDQFFTALVLEQKIDGKVLGFIVYNSLKPSLTVFSRMVSKHLDSENVWDKGYCPVCGSVPEISVFEDNGKRSLICGFCSHKWLSKRVFCSFCENTDHETLHYYEIEDESEYRVDVCDKCNKFIKTVDIKKLSRPVYLPLETVSTPYIDIKFKEMGYISGNAVNI